MYVIVECQKKIYCRLYLAGTEAFIFEIQDNVLIFCLLLLLHEILSFGFFKKTKSVKTFLIVA